MNAPGRLVLVLGMHRSGTSTLARGLRVLGVALGKNLLPAHPCNPKGFFEDAGLYAFNKALLAQLGLTWRSPEAPDTAALRRQAAGPPGVTALGLLREKSAGQAILGLKDPRMSRLLRAFAARWQARSRIPLLLENVDSCDVLELGKTFPADHGLGLCLDVGHLLGYAQDHLLNSELPETAALVHWSAPGRKDQHLPLTEFTMRQRRTAAALMGRLPHTAVHLAEIFHWPGVAASLPVLAALAREALPEKTDPNAQPYENTHS